MAEGSNVRRARTERTLTIDPRIRRIGAACFEGALLGDWAIKNIRRDPADVRVRKRIIPMLIRMLDRCNPAVLLVPNVGRDGVRRSANVREMIRVVTREALNRGIQVCAVSERQVKATFGMVRRGAGQNKQTINEVLVEWFPELGPSRPKARRVWDSERHATPLFDAMARWVAWRGVPKRFRASEPSAETRARSDED